MDTVSFTLVNGGYGYISHPRLLLINLEQVELEQVFSYNEIDSLSGEIKSIQVDSGEADMSLPMISISWFSFY